MCASESLPSAARGISPQRIHQDTHRAAASLPTLAPQHFLTQLKTQKSISGMRTLMW